MKKEATSIRLRKSLLAPNTSTSLRTTLAADALLAEGQFLLEEIQTLDKTKSLLYRAGTAKQTVFKTYEQNLGPTQI
jgi:hypothetical protein